MNSGQPASKTLFFIAGPLLLIALFCVYKIGSNIWDYNRMRVMPVEVVTSSLLVDADSERYPFFVLRMNLRSTDSSDRRIRFEEEISQAFYIEEAYDELRRWAPGTKHNVQFLRGQAREIRIEVSGTNPELQAAGGWTFGAGFALMVAIPIIGVIAPEDSRMRRLGVDKHMGPWLALAVFGFFPLAGAIGFAIVETPKRFQWKPVTGVPVDREQLPPAPADVEITPQVKPILVEKRAAYFVKHDWNGRIVYGGLGLHNGPYADVNSTCESSDKSCTFFVSPTNRWEVKRTMAFNEEYWAPLGILTFFGVVFTGASLVVRKVMSNPLIRAQWVRPR